MAAFEFKLQRVLDVRNLKEKQVKLKYYQEKQKQQKLGAQITLLKQERDSIYNYLRDKTLTLEENIRGRSYLSQHTKKIDRVKEELNNQKKKVSEVKKELIDKKKKKEIMEKLKEKEYERFYKEFFHNQQKELDEIGIYFNKSQGL